MVCIIFIRSIVFLDEVLPLIFELKKAGLASKPLFIANNRQTYEYLRKNIVLYEGIHSIGGRLSYLYRYKNSYMNQIYNIIVLRKYLYKKVISVETYDIGNLLVSLLMAYNRKILKGKRIKSLLFNRPYEQSINNLEIYRIVRGESEKKEAGERVLNGYDGIIMSHTKEQYEVIYNQKLITDCPAIRVGYTRGLLEWQRFLDKNTSRYFPEEIKGPYFFFNLNRVCRWMKEEDCAPSGEIFKESLLILKNFNDDIMTVFKPHNNTDVDKAVEIIKSTGYKNYIISYSHPSLLIKNAKFTFSYTASSISVEAYYLGCPTVEYTHYDSRFFKWNKWRPLYLDSVDFFIHRDPKQLKIVLEKLIYEDIKIQREPHKLRNGFPVLSHDEIREAFCRIR